MARVNVLGGGKLRGWSIVSLASGMVILCLLGLFFPTLRAMVPPPPTPEPPPGTPAASNPPGPPVVPSMSSTSVPNPQVSGPPGDDGQPGGPDRIEANPPPAPGDKR